MPQRVRIVIVNKSTVVQDSDVKLWTEAVFGQAKQFAEQYGLREPLVEFAEEVPTSKADTVVAIMDNSDQAGALGYHSEDDGIPFARVFAVDCQQANMAVSVCISHEVLEAIADLACDKWADGPDGESYAYEVCDPVEGLTYKVGAVELSDYVLPSWFDDEGEAPFDFLHQVTKPFEIAKVGYAVVEKDGAAKQVFGDRLAYDALIPAMHATKLSPLARTYRRLDGFDAAVDEPEKDEEPAPLPWIVYTYEEISGTLVCHAYEVDSQADGETAAAKLKATNPNQSQMVLELEPLPA